jgi:hypothetical protein
MNLQLKNTQFTEKERILSYIYKCYIVDVGFIKSIEDDKKFVEVTHANKKQLYNIEKDSFDTQEETVTKHVEILYIGSSYYQETFDLKTGDIGLLLGTKSYVEKIRDVTEAKKSDMISNYQQENLKFLPLANNQTPKIKLHVDSDSKKLTETYDSQWGNIVITKGATGVKIVVNENLTFFMDKDTGKFKIENTTYNLKSLIDDLFSDLASAQTSIDGAPHPHTHSVLGISDTVTFNLLKAKFDALLE